MPPPVATPPPPQTSLGPEFRLQDQPGADVGSTFSQNGNIYRVTKVIQRGAGVVRVNAILIQSGQQTPRAPTTQRPPTGDEARDIANLLGLRGRGTGATATSTTETGGTPREVLERQCAAGDVLSCQFILELDRSGAGGLTFEEQRQLDQLSEQAATDRQRLADEAALERLMTELNLTLGAGARERAQGVTESISSGFSEALSALGMAAPQIFLANAGDPAGLRDAILEALGSGEGVFPTLERQELIAEAAQSPRDVIRLLFLAGGQTPPARRTGAFNVESVLEGGQRAREDLARQISNIPRVTFEELVQRFTPPVPPIGAARGAVVEMRRRKDGVYEAAGGATVVEGPELFTVGEAGTEFALLAPGSIIAPKASKDEPETRENASRAVMEVLMHGRRTNGDSPRRAQDGAIMPASEADLPGDLWSSFLEGLGGAAAALQKPQRGFADRIRDFRLQPFPFPELNFSDRASRLQQMTADPMIAALLQDISGVDRTFNQALFPLRSQEQTAFINELLAGTRPLDTRTASVALQLGLTEVGNAITQLTGRQIDEPEVRSIIEGALSPAEAFANDELTPEERDFVQGLLDRGIASDPIAAQMAQQLGLDRVANALLRFSSGLTTEAELRDLLEARTITPEELKGIRGFLDFGASGTNLPFAEISQLPAGSRAAVLSVMGSLFGADVIADLVDLFETGRSRAFSAGETLLGTATR